MVAPESSASTRKAGVKVSSYWPLRTAQTKPSKNASATPRLANINIITTLMHYYLSKAAGNHKFYPPVAKKDKRDFVG